MADTPTVEPATAVPVQSIEVESEVKQEDAAEEKSDVDGAEAEGNDATGEEPGVSNEQYKALRNITETLTNHKMKLKGDEYVHRIFGLTTVLTCLVSIILLCCLGASPIDETYPTTTK
jgi:hypothetical protein